MFETMFGSEMPLAARFFIAFLVVLGLIGVTAWLVRRFGASRLGGGTARGRQPRLAVIDAATVDARRRLVLIRRDNVEHLLIIGGPTDVVVEQNIVRAVGARDTARAGLTELGRNGPAAETAWPLQPVTEPPPVAPVAPVPSAPPQRSYRPAATDEPWLPPEPGARPRPPDSITGMPSEFSSRVNAPEAPTRPQPSPAAPPSAKNIDQNLAEMAQQLEAALRRAPQPEHRPPVTDPLAMQAELAPRDSKPRAEIKVGPKVEAKLQPKMEPKIEPKLDVKPEPRFEQKFEPKGEIKVEPKFEPKIEPKVQFKSEPKLEAKPEIKLEQPMPVPKLEPLKAEPAGDKTLYDNLEEEMASLLGRPSGKT